MAPMVQSDSLAYAYAANNNASCGSCYQLTFTGQSHNGGTPDQGSAAMCGKSIIVQVVNTGNITSGQFDLLIPGGGVGQFNACSNQWHSSNLGVQYGGLMLQCEQDNNYDYAKYTQCTIDACKSLFSSNSQMEQGCEFIINWMKGADNPSVMYQSVSCPSQLRNNSGL